MPEKLLIFLLFAAVAVLVVVVGFIGNKIVDKSTDAIRNKTVREKAEEPLKNESLADRYAKGGKL